MENRINNIITTAKESLAAGSFVKLSLGAYKGDEEDLKSIQIKRVLIKKKDKLSFTYRYKTKDIVKNYLLEEAFSIIEKAIDVNGFRLVRLCTIDADTLLEYINNERWRIKNSQPSIKVLPSLDHDQKKVRKIEAIGKQYLHELKITNKEGEVYKNAQDKYKQINHYVEILSSLLKKLPNKAITKVVDMGAGKGYLTFALYDYLNNVLNKPAEVIGVEYRKDLVDLCNKIANKSDFAKLKFVQGEIEKYENNDIDVLIALHACDTATDDAIYMGIKSSADLIVVAPCCHKQIRREIEKHKAKNDLDFLLKYGIFLERQAEMVTDGIRALILEYYGYSTKVVEFVSDAHTPKNVLIIASKNKNAPIQKEDILRKIIQTRSLFGIGYHHLERKMGLS